MKVHYTSGIVETRKDGGDIFSGNEMPKMQIFIANVPGKYAIVLIMNDGYYI